MVHLYQSDGHVPLSIKVYSRVERIERGGVTCIVYNGHIAHEF